MSSYTSTYGTCSTRGQPANPIHMGQVASIILGGGRGTRLFPLTHTRCKPAITFGGRYRLIDVPVSNSINSGIDKLFIVTQFLSSSLHQHLINTYQFDRFSSGFIEVLAAEQKPSSKAWFQGTADAVRQNLDYVMETPAEYFLILSGDQLYNIDFRQMYTQALESDADCTIAALPVKSKDAHRMGILQVDEKRNITRFIEKPQDLDTLRAHSSDPQLLKACGLTCTEEECFLGSMGIYLFKRRALEELLSQDGREDFGKHLIPSLIGKKNVSAFLYNGYWEDIGTIESFYKANLSLTQENAPFDCYDESNKIFTNPFFLPGTKIRNSQIHDAIICEGSVVSGAQISHSVLGCRTIIHEGCRISDSYIMGNDFYEPPIRDSARFPEQLHVGENSVIERAILDKNVHIGKNVQLINKNNIAHYNGDGLYIRDGITIVTRGASIPDDFTLWKEVCQFGP